MDIAVVAAGMVAEMHQIKVMGDSGSRTANIDRIRKLTLKRIKDIRLISRYIDRTTASIAGHPLTYRHRRRITPDRLNRTIDPCERLSRMRQAARDCKHTRWISTAPRISHGDTDQRPGTRDTAAAARTGADKRHRSCVHPSAWHHGLVSRCKGFHRLHDNGTNA